ncbi:MAG: acyltransferase family protein [Ilumatobacter sp.]
MTTTDASAASRDTGPVTRPLVRPELDEHQYGEHISQLPYLPGLDGIRAIAVVAVMVYHANSDWLAGGYLGVEVFFVISGYLITLLLIAEHERTGVIDLKSFWIRRFRRLLPALFVMMLLLSVWVALFERDALGKLRGDVLAGVLYGSNWYQIWTGAGYSAGNDFAPLRHLWSLAVEEQFYVVWPLVMMAFVRVGSRRIAGIARWLFLGSVVVTVAVALLHHPGPQAAVIVDDLGVATTDTPGAYWEIGGRFISKPDALYLSTLSRAGGLLLGSAFAMVWRPTAIMRGPLRNKGRLFDVLAVIGFVVLGVMSWFVGFQPALGVDNVLFRGGLFLTGLASLAIIAAVTHQNAMTGRVLSQPVLLWIGTRSYGLYLYHWPIYQIIRNIAANKLAFHEFVLAMVATAIITELSYRFIETPIRKGKFGELVKRRRAGVVSQPSLTPGQRQGALAGAAVATALSVFAVGSMATAELKQNAVQEGIDAGKEFSCDILQDPDCDGVFDFDDQGNPLAAAADDGAIFESGDSESDIPSEGGVVEPDPESTEDPNAEVGEVPGTTEPPPEEPAPLVKLALGDSVMLGAAGPLTELGFTVDAEESRAWVRGIDIVERLGQADRLPDVLVLHLGTNGPISESRMERMMAGLESVPTVLLLTNSVDRDYTDENNRLIFGAADTYPNVQLLDWNGFTGSCPGDCFESDGFHLRPDGRNYYAQLIDESIEV